MTAFPTLHLSATDLFDKFGFGDGDAIRHWLDKVTEQTGFDHNIRPEHQSQVLLQAIRENLVPLLPVTDCRLEVIGGNHNPIRITTWRGQPYTRERPVPEELTDIVIEVPGTEILALVRKYPLHEVRSSDQPPPEQQHAKEAPQ